MKIKFFRFVLVHSQADGVEIEKFQGDLTNNFIETSALLTVLTPVNKNN